MNHNQVVANSLNTSTVIISHGLQQQVTPTRKYTNQLAVPYELV